jgi:hypothetical protein
MKEKQMRSLATTPFNLPAPIGIPPRRPDHPQTSELIRVSENKSICLLSVGRMDPALLAISRLRNDASFIISVAKDYRDLWLRSGEESVEIALLHNSLCSFELEQAARLIRRRWPKAKILILRSGRILITRVVYDEWLSPSISSEALLKRVFKSVKPSREGRSARGDC